MSISSRERSPPPLLSRPLDDRPLMFGHEPPFCGRAELNPWHPAVGNQLAAELAERDEEGEEQDDGGIPRRRAQRGIPPAQVPALGPRLLPAVQALTDDLTAETAGRDRFQTITPAYLRHAAETFAHYRLTSLGIIRHTDRDARRMFLSYLGELDHLPSPQMQLIMQLLAHFTPQIMKSRADAKDPMFGELVIPERLRNFPADLPH